MPKHQSKSWMERSQEVFGVTKNELRVAVTIVSLTLASLAYRWIANPADPLNQLLNQQLSHVVDSLTAAKKSIQETRDSSSSIDTNSFVPQMVFHPPSKYQKKEMPKAPIDVNIATKQELMRLPGVGEKMAENIIQYRSTKKFGKTDDMMLVKGIGKKKFEKMKNFVTVE